MNIYNPFFSISIILLQLFFSIKEFYDIKAWKKANPDLEALMNIILHYDTLFLFVLILGLFEILTEPNGLKKITRTLLITIVFGYQISKINPFKDLNFAIYNTACLSAIIAFVLILVKLNEQLRKNIKNRIR